jgi:hypothetical protein
VLDYTSGIIVRKSYNGLSTQYRPEAGSSSIHDEAEDVEEQPLIRHRSRQTSSGSMESAREAGVVEASPPSSPGRSNIGSHPLHNVDAFSDEVSSTILLYNLSTLISELRTPNIL